METFTTGPLCLAPSNISYYSLPASTPAALFFTSPSQSLSPSYPSIIDIDFHGIWDKIYQNLPDSSHPPSSSDGPRVVHWTLLIHLLCVIPAFFLAFPLYMMKKGTRIHKLTGRVFMALMFVGVVITYPIKLLRRQDTHRDFICRLSPSFHPDLFCRFSLFHLGTTITLSHIVLSMVSIKRGDIKAHKRWTFWVTVAVVVGGPLLPRERLTAMWLRGEMPAWQPID